jgi:hypothetical protein
MKPLDAANGIYSVAVTVPPKAKLIQRFFKPILVDDPNWSRFQMTDADGPAALVRLRSEEELKKVEGSFLQRGDALWIHVFPHRGDRPSARNTDLKIVTGEAIRIDPQIEHVAIENIRTWGTVRVRGKQCTLRGIRAAPGHIWLEGEENLLERSRIAHTNFRTAQGGYRWYESGSGHGLFLWGRNNTVRHTEILHCWNGVASNTSVGALADGLIIHGMPNHSWQPGYSRDLTIRNCVIYNAQDAFYINSCTHLRVENCTLFAGNLIQEVPKEHEYGRRAAAQGLPVLGGPYIFHNNIILGCAWQATSGWGVNVDSTWERGTVFENNIILPRRPGKEIQHTIGRKVKRWMTLEEYAAEAAKHPGGNWATVRNNIVLESRDDFDRVFVGGAWKPETDVWDFRLKPGPDNPAIDSGADVGFQRDFHGRPRKAGRAVDIGAEEYRNER